MTQKEPRSLTVPPVLLLRIFRNWKSLEVEKTTQLHVTFGILIQHVLYLGDYLR